ncbi:hypothetical protein BDB00DRAFT_755249 [Zychaea mexicana]|uniref:uncharacterized protein n=1 Tax=Zychaea mexicana TaxID=64656 RepID=UPI0022FE40CF|nr:uncharacterized protein BDB00DRAFT_755249 [Zychaea mexicana]KAI9498078.1 hypothetical protein BDB00DRAFT_755249 [Zychaea mexicana]
MLGLVVSASPAPPTNSVTECQTQACIDAAKAVKDYIDFNADPCTDFYQYACGAWLKSTSIPDDKASVGTFDTVQDQNTDTIRNLLEGTYGDIIKDTDCSEENFHYQSQSDIDKQNFEELQNYYTSCMDVATIEALGPTPVYPTISKLLKIFSFGKENTQGQQQQQQQQQNDDVYTAQSADMLTDALIELYRQGVQPMFSMVIGADDKQPDANAVQINQPGLALPSKEYYEQKDTVDTYRSGLIEVLTILIGSADDVNNSNMGAQKQKEAQNANIQLLSSEQIKDMVNRVVDFESKLASITLDRDQLLDPTKLYNPMPLNEIQQRYPVINWKKFFEAFLPTGTPVPDTLIVSAPPYFTNLASWLLPSLSSPSTDMQQQQQQGVRLQTIQDFLLVKNLKAWIYALDTNTRRSWRRTSAKISSGSFELPPRYRTCVDNVIGSFGSMVGRFFVMRRFGGEEEREQVDDFISQVHQAWLDRLDKVEWLDPETRKAAIDKVSKIKHKIAYSIVSPDVRSPESLRDHYESIKITRESFFSNELSIVEWAINRAWSKVGKPVDKEEWFMSPSDVNAYYSRSTNEIAVPAGILQVPFYNYGAPWYLNYGSIGAIIGHELTHAFDSAGRMYDGDGKLKDWWSPDTAKRFQDKSQCFVQQYNGFTVEGPNKKSVNVNGQLTLAENLADNGGIAASYQAFQKVWNDAQSPGQPQHARLPGIDLSPEALFYTSYARSWCSAVRPEALVQQVYTDVHSPERYRVIGTVQNSADFAKVFQCPQSTPMNPENKCVIW